MPRYRCHRPFHVLLGIPLPQHRRLPDIETLRDVTVQGVVSARLVGDQIRGHTALDDLRQHIGAVAQQANGDGFAALFRADHSVQRLIQVLGGPVEVSGLETPLDAGGVNLDAEKGAAVHHRRQRLRPTHAAKPTR